MPFQGRARDTALPLVVVATVALWSIAGHAQGPADGAHRLAEAKAQLYRSNFRNDRAGLRTGIRRAAAVRSDAVVGPLGLYYAAWGEWVLSHSELQNGEMAAARATLSRAESFARSALELRPEDVEFIVLLADVLIWRLVAAPQDFAAIAPEVRTLRTRALGAQPDNPRALIMDAGLIFNTPPDRGGDRAKGLALWERALDRFEFEAATPAADPLRPDWGRALSYAWECALHLAMRPPQVEAARSAARKALALVPDFWYVETVILPRLR
jgi:hypothetical protein